MVFNGFQSLDLTGPLEVFENCNNENSRHYLCQVYSSNGGLVKSSSGLEINSQPLSLLKEFDSLVIVGGAVTFATQESLNLINFLKSNASRAMRIISICTGAFFLCQAGLLDNRRVTTHWKYVDRLKSENSTLDVLEDALYVQDGNVFTSAGVTAGMDLALSLVETDLGKKLALKAAKSLVIYYHRHGGQTQFSEPLKSQFKQNKGRFEEICHYILSNKGAPLSVDMLANKMNMSTRNFSRQFTTAIGIAPGKYIEKVRLQSAIELLEAGEESFKTIADLNGFNSVEVFRRTFIRQFGVTPTVYQSRVNKKLIIIEE